jgi:hypothetical protein
MTVDAVDLEAARRDARVATIQARAEMLRQGEEGRRDARVAAICKQGEQLERCSWRRTAELKGPGGDTATAVLGRISTDPAHPTVDRQGDTLRPGLLRNPPGDRVPVSEWQHSYLRNPEAPAAGFATVWEQDGELRARVTFNDTPEGRNAARRVHELLPDWSWGLSEIESAPLTAAERAAGAVRAIAKVRIIEVSPVDRAASIASGTLSSHCESCALAGSGKCSAGSCATDAGFAPCHPRRRQQEVRLAAILATDAEDRERRVAGLMARGRELNAAAAGEALRIAIAESDRHRRLRLLRLALT